MREVVELKLFERSGSYTMGIGDCPVDAFVLWDYNNERGVSALSGGRVPLPACVLRASGAVRRLKNIIFCGCYAGQSWFASPKPIQVSTPEGLPPPVSRKQARQLRQCLI